MPRTCAAAFAALFCCCLALPAAAQTVTLTSPDGQTEISGRFLSYDGAFYRLDTVYGTLTIDGSGVTCAGEACPDIGDFVADVALSGSATMGAVLMPALLEGFAQRNGLLAERVNADETEFKYVLTDTRTEERKAEFVFRATTSDEGFADLLADEADVVMSLREIGDAELQRAREAGMGDMAAANRAYVVALDALIPVVSAQSPVRAISPLDAARISAGQIETWTALGGSDAPIDLHLSAPATGLGQAMQQQLLDPVSLSATPRAATHGRGASLSAAVARDPLAFGIASFAEIGNAQPVALQDPCGRVVRASRQSIKTGDYPLTAPLFLYTPARRLPQIARAFLAFTQTRAAQLVVERAGFVDQRMEEIAIDAQGDRFANAISAAGFDVSLKELQRMTALLKPMRRLTLSFRFEPGSTRLDALSRANLNRLARQVQQGRYAGRQLYFVGFSSGIGSADRNRAMAEDQAQAVRDAVVSAAQSSDMMGIEIKVDAFGEALPIACDESAWGRKANHRVEVWLR